MTSIGSAGSPRDAHAGNAAIPCGTGPGNPEGISFVLVDARIENSVVHTDQALARIDRS